MPRLIGTVSHAHLELVLLALALTMLIVLLLPSGMTTTLPLPTGTITWLPLPTGTMTWLPLPTGTLTSLPLPTGTTTKFPLPTTLPLQIGTITLPLPIGITLPLPIGTTLPLPIGTVLSLPTETLLPLLKGTSKWVVRLGAPLKKVRWASKTETFEKKKRVLQFGPSAPHCWTPFPPYCHGCHSKNLPGQGGVYLDRVVGPRQNTYKETICTIQIIKIAMGRKI